MSQLTNKNDTSSQNDAAPNFDDNEEFQNIEKQINNQIGKMTTNIGQGINRLKTLTRQRALSVSADSDHAA